MTSWLQIQCAVRTYDEARRDRRTMTRSAVDRQAPVARARLVREEGRRGAARGAARPAGARGSASCERCSAASAAAPSGLSSTGRSRQSEWERMRAPLQEGAFPFPVKYGYCATGVVEEGPQELAGHARCSACIRTRTSSSRRSSMLAPVPDGVPPRRATLAANMETALNALWDGGAGPADRIVVVGGGVVGLLDRLSGRAAAGRRGDAGRRRPEPRGRWRRRLGAGFATPADAPAEADVVFHASATRRRARHGHRLRRHGGDDRRDELVRRQRRFSAVSAAPFTAGG